MDLNDMSSGEILLAALWKGVARLVPATDEIAIDGLRYGVELYENGIPIIKPPILAALAKALGKEDA